MIKPLLKIPNWLLAVFTLICFGGFLDSTYLAAKHFLGSPVTCSLLKGCEIVTSSKYSVVFGVPVAAFGVLYYLTILILMAIYLETKRDNVIKAAAYITPAGFMASLYFLYLQFFIIQAFCLYCLISAASSTLLFLIGLWIIHTHRKGLI